MTGWPSIFFFTFLLGTFLFFFLSFLFELRPGWLLPLHYFVLQSFLNTHTLTKRLTVLACSDNIKDVRTPSVFENIGWRYRRGRKKTLSSQKKKTQFFFFFSP